MAYLATPEDIQRVRYELNDNAPGLYILDDSSISYYLEKNSGSIARTSIECARAILLRLAMDSRESVCDVLSVKTSKQAEQYRLALELYLKNPFTNPLIGSASGWAGGISVSEMQANNANCDNNVSPLAEITPRCYPNDNPFAV